MRTLSMREVIERLQEIRQLFWLTGDALLYTKGVNFEGAAALMVQANRVDEEIERLLSIAEDGLNKTDPNLIVLFSAVAERLESRRDRDVGIAGIALEGVIARIKDVTAVLTAAHGAERVVEVMKAGSSLPGTLDQAALAALIRQLQSVADRAEVATTRLPAPAAAANRSTERASAHAEQGPITYVSRDERSTERWRNVMLLASQESQRFNHEYVGTEHILLGIIKEGTGVGWSALRLLKPDLTPQLIIGLLESEMRTGPDMVVLSKLPMTPRAKKAIEFAIQEANKLQHKYLGTEHLVIGLIMEKDGVAAQVLTKLGFTVEAVREEIKKVLAVGSLPTC